MMPPKVVESQTFAPLRVVAELLDAFFAAKLVDEADEIAPATPDADAAPACVLKSKNLGNATADKMPKITITITSSMSVKPFCALTILFSHVFALAGYDIHNATELINLQPNS